LSEDMYRKRLADLKKKEAELRTKQSREDRGVSKLREEIGRLERSITPRTSDSIRRQKSRQIETKAKKAANGASKVAKYETEIAKNLGEQRRVQNSLDQAVSRRTKKEDTEAKKRRDSVDLVFRLAVRTEDLFQALNEHRPDVVHFSGHGSEDSVVFQDPEGYTKAVSKEAISAMIAATRGRIRLIVFNTCFSRSQAEAVASHVGTAIGMNAPIGDGAARTFASQLYSAIGFGLSVEAAFDQAVARLMVEGIPEEKTPELFAADGVDPDAVVLVRPESV
jgi:hypothetical protein